MNRFIVANILVLIFITSGFCWAIWSFLELFLAWKILCSIVAFFVAGFVEERCLSRHVNTLVNYIGRKKTSDSRRKDSR